MIRKRFKGLLFIYLSILIASLLTQIFLPSISKSDNALNSIFLMILFTLSWFFVHIGVQNNPKRFVVNFMIMTVMQFLAFLTFELVLVMNNAAWIQVIHALGLCIVLLIIQTVALAQSGKS